jgi:hypothetical protein
LEVNIDKLGLTDVGITTGRDIENLDRLDVVRNAGDVLNEAVMPDDLILHPVIP